MSAVEDAAADVVGAKQGQIAVLALTTSSVSFDMWAQFPKLAEAVQKYFVKIFADQTLYFFWTDTAGQTVNEATTGAASATGGQCDAMAAGAPEQHKVGGRYLVIKGAGAGTVRVSLMQSLPGPNFLRREP